MLSVGKSPSDNHGLGYVHGKVASRPPKIEWHLKPNTYMTGHTPACILQEHLPGNTVL